MLLESTHRILPALLGCLLLSTLSPVRAEQSSSMQAIQDGHRAILGASQMRSTQAILDDNRAILDSLAFQQVQQQQQAQNRQTIGQVTHTLLDEVKTRLPSPQAVATDLVHGTHLTVSAAGRQVVVKMIALMSAPAAEQRQILQQLQAQAQNGVPEAQNFMGFVAEAGGFGVPRNLATARAYYQAAAGQGYAPAMYNLALMQAYGRGVPSSLPQALTWARRAQALGGDTSYRVCGMTSFLAYKTGQTAIAQQASVGCVSPLAELVRGRFDSGLSVPARIQLARNSLMTGVDDGFAVIESLTQGQRTYPPCRYQLVRQYLYKTDLNTVSEEAARCYRQSQGAKASPSVLDQQQIKGLAGFALAEVQAIRQQRRANHVHYAWPVPYLPFPALDAQRFAPFLKGLSS